MNSQLVRRVLLAVAIIVAAAAAIPGFHYYRYIESHVSTDDAYVDGTVALVSSRVAGTVTNVYVEDNWTVKEGQLLLTLDSRDFDVRVEQAQAQLERARQSVDELYAVVDAARAGVALTVSELKQAQIDFVRAKSLKEQGVVSIEQYDQANTALRVAMADEALAEHQLTQAQAALGSRNDGHSRYALPGRAAGRSRSGSRQARSRLHQTDRAVPGIVTHKTAHVGNRVQVGEPLLAVVPLGKLYITANFKETQLTDVRVGQKAEIVADIYPDYTYRGHVDSISMGTGAAFSLLPPENATGNWVKVVQRVPVKIVIDGPRAPGQTAAAGTVGRSRDRSRRSQRTLALVDRAAAFPERRPDSAQRDTQDGAEAAAAGRSAARHRNAATFHASLACPDLPPSAPRIT